MVLDAIVESPELVWLATAEEKTAHLTALATIDPADLPHVTIGEGDKRTIRCFPERLPIGIHPEGRGALVYVVTDAILDEFRVFLERHGGKANASDPAARSDNLSSRSLPSRQGASGVWVACMDRKVVQ